MDETATSMARPLGEARPAPFRTRLTALLAAEGNRAVILRRGPKTHFNLITWDLTRDSFESGQWMKGAVSLCDLSPSGDKLLYWAAQYHRSAAWRWQDGEGFEAYDPLRQSPVKARPGRKLPRYLRSDQGDRKPRPRQNTGTWTAVSTPPFFTALALWPAIGTWTGGGGFVSERTIFLYEGEDGLLPIAHVPLPRDMRVAPASAARLGTAPRRSAAAPLYAPNETYGRVLDEVHGRIWLALVESGLALLDWSHPKDGDLLFAGSGCVYRLERWREVAPEQYFARARVLADFSGDRFRLVTAPRSAMRW